MLIIHFKRTHLVDYVVWIYVHNGMLKQGVPFISITIDKHCWLIITYITYVTLHQNPFKFSTYYWWGWSKFIMKSYIIETTYKGFKICTWHLCLQWWYLDTWKVSCNSEYESQATEDSHSARYNHLLRNHVNYIMWNNTSFANSWLLIINLGYYQI